MAEVQFKDVFANFAAQTINGVRCFQPKIDIRAFSAEGMMLNEARMLKTASTVALEAATLPVEARPPKQLLRSFVGKTWAPYSEEIGTHPDFRHLENEDQVESHYIVSVFVDIKGSTELALKMDLQDVRVFKNGLITTVIDIFQALDAHIHRLQGDAVLAYFGGKRIKKSQAIIDALNAATFLQYFCEKNLNPIFSKLSFPPLKIRIGIDFGDDNKVLWAKYGVKNCKEVTTTSLHTDLAAKLQTRAPANGIMIGENIREFLDLPQEFYNTKPLDSSNRNEDSEYILKLDAFSYKMWFFDWKKYFARFLFNPERSDTSTFKAGLNFRFKCFYKPEDSNDEWKEYLPNSYPIPKKYDLEFRLTNIVFHFDSIRWIVKNRGTEAETAKTLSYEMTTQKNHTTCLQSTAYKGHHYMICEIGYQKRIVGKEYFGLYINND